MKAVGAVLKEHGIHAFAMPAGLNLGTAYRFLPLLYGAGGRVFNDDWTKAAFSGPAGRAALQFLVDLKDAGVHAGGDLSLRLRREFRPLDDREGGVLHRGALVAGYRAWQLRLRPVAARAGAGAGS